MKDLNYYRNEAYRHKKAYQTERERNKKFFARYAEVMEAIKWIAMEDGEHRVTPDRYSMRNRAKKEVEGHKQWLRGEWEEK